MNEYIEPHNEIIKIMTLQVSRIAGISKTRSYCANSDSFTRALDIVKEALAIQNSCYLLVSLLLKIALFCFGCPPPGDLYGEHDMTVKYLEKHYFIVSKDVDRPLA